MKKHKSLIIMIALVLGVLLLPSCDNENHHNRKELLVYCGITMIRPMTEIKEIIEKQENCHIEITKGGSGNLLKAIEQSHIGDLYIPGSSSYILSAYEKDLIQDTVTVGENRLAFMVQKGNPMKIQPEVKSLINKDYYVVIGNPNSGSVGKATKKLLVSEGVFEEVEQNAIRFTTDSKDLSMALINREADLVVNWYATYTWDNNSDYMDLLEVPGLEITKEKLVLAQLKSSQYPDIAQKFMLFAKSTQGQAIFEKYGLK
jgi:molybdate transport system substrate-binding protein